MSIREVAYSYENVENLEANKEEALARFWDEIIKINECRVRSFDNIVCKGCGAKLNFVRAFWDLCIFVDNCKNCGCLNVFTEEDVPFVDGYSHSGVEIHKEEILENVWMCALQMVETRLPENCDECGSKLPWVCIFDELHQYACQCPKCKKGYWQRSY